MFDEVAEVLSVVSVVLPPSPAIFERMDSSVLCDGALEEVSVVEVVSAAPRFAIFERIESIEVVEFSQELF